jgi:hypothetical protein
LLQLRRADDGKRYVAAVPAGVAVVVVAVVVVAAVVVVVDVVVVDVVVAVVVVVVVAVVVAGVVAVDVADVAVADVVDVTDDIADVIAVVVHRFALSAAVIPVLDVALGPLPAEVPWSGRRNSTPNKMIQNPRQGELHDLQLAVVCRAAFQNRTLAGES